MPDAINVSPDGAKTSYRYNAELIDWEGQPVSAIVIRAHAREDGFAAMAQAARGLLSEHSYLSAGLWAVFVKTTAQPPAPKWLLLGQGSGKQELAADAVPSSDVSAAVIRQLETLFSD